VADRVRVKVLDRNPGHITHVYLRTQGRARFEFVDLANDARVDVVPAPGASAPVPGAGTPTGDNH